LFKSVCFNRIFFINNKKTFNGCQQKLTSKKENKTYLCSLMYKRIDSPQNTVIKQLIQLREKSRIRRKEQRFLIEGVQELKLALKLAYRTTTEGVVGLTNFKDTDISSLRLKTENPLILVAEAPEKPGNIGAILRTADAANVDAVIIANPKTDLYNPNVIRSSVGGVFTNTVATGSTSEIIKYLQERKINIYGAILQSSTSYIEQNYTKPTAIVVGTEHEGLSEEWRKNTTQNIIIPMEGSIDSMNVSVAVGILIFEAKRQRGF